MIQYDLSNRPRFSEIRRNLVSFDAISEQISATNMNITLPSGSMPTPNSMDLSFHNQLLSNLNKSIVVSDDVGKSVISGSIHDQKESHLFWAFSVSTVIAAELRRLIYRLRQKGYISPSVQENALKQADQINKSNRLMFELVCLINPRSPKLEDFFGSRAASQAASPTTVMERICYDGILRPAGWTRLPSIRRVTDILTEHKDSNQSMVTSIKFQPAFYNHPKSSRQSQAGILKQRFWRCHFRCRCPKKFLLDFALAVAQLKK